MRELFLQIVYGRSQTAFSEDGLPIGAGLDDLGKGLRSMTGTIFSTKEKGVRYLELTEGYINKLAVDENDEVIGYQFVKLGKMMEDIRHGKTPNEAYEKNVHLRPLQRRSAPSSTSTRVRNKRGGTTHGNF